MNHLLQPIGPIPTRQTPGQATSGVITLSAGLIMCLLLGIMVVFAGCTPPKPKVENTSQNNIFHDPLQMFNGVPLRTNYHDFDNATPVEVSRETIQRIRQQVKDRFNQTRR